jgi:hypothetical protein
MKVGDLVKRVGVTPDEIADYAELGVGVVVEIEDKNCDAWLDINFVVMWPKHGFGWEWADMLEVIQ